MRTAEYLYELSKNNGPRTNIGSRIKKDSFKLIAEHLDSDEHALFSFYGDTKLIKDLSKDSLVLEAGEFTHCKAIIITNKRLIIAQRTTVYDAMYMNQKVIFEILDYLEGISLNDVISVSSVGDIYKYNLCIGIRLKGKYQGVVINPMVVDKQSHELNIKTMTQGINEIIDNN